MKRYWFVFVLAVAAAALFAGCAPQKPATTPEQAAAEAQAKAEQAKEKAEQQMPSQLTINPANLPAPRPALAASPDLSGATLVVNNATLAKMTADGVPTSVTSALGSLKDKVFTNSSDFADAVRGAAGTGANAYMDQILRDALVVSLADEAPMPEGEVSIVKREGEMAPQPAEGQSEFGIVYFDFDKYNIKTEFEKTIQENAKKLMADPSIHVQVEGHCDERGTPEYNLALGQRRADAVRRALIAAGVNPDQMTTISYGEERPVALGHNEAAWAKNRRSVLTITSK